MCTLLGLSRRERILGTAVGFLEEEKKVAELREISDRRKMNRKDSSQTVWLERGLSIQQGVFSLPRN